MPNTIKKKAKSFIRKHKLKTVSFENLKAVAEKSGYTVIEYNTSYNDENVRTIIFNLNLQKEIVMSKGFTYVDKNYRLIFINEDLTDEEKTLVLTHELGHIECGHLSLQYIIGKDIKEEHEANEFSHYLLNVNMITKGRITVSEHKKLFVAVIILLLITLITSVVIVSVKKEKSYYADYYITSSGSKYHKKECIFVKNNKTAKRLTKEEFETEKYSACNICLPD